MPSGYKLVITRALGLHGIYCTQPSGLAPSCFSAIYSVHPLCPCYNYNLTREWIRGRSPEKIKGEGLLGCSITVKVLSTKGYKGS